VNEDVFEQDVGDSGPETGRRPRADAQRNLVTLLDAAKAIFAQEGVDAPVRAIAERAGVGIGTVYRHFPRRADLIAAVFRQEIDACAETAEQLARTHPPVEALSLWMRRFVELAATKHGLAQALHSGDPAYEALPARRETRLLPAFQALFDTAQATGEIRKDVASAEFLSAAASLCASAGAANPDLAQRLVTLLVDGLRHSN